MVFLGSASRLNAYEVSQTQLDDLKTQIVICETALASVTGSLLSTRIALIDSQKTAEQKQSLAERETLLRAKEQSLREERENLISRLLENYLEQKANSERQSKLLDESDASLTTLRADLAAIRRTDTVKTYVIIGLALAAIAEAVILVTR